MTELLVLLVVALVVALVVIASASLVGPRLRVAAPLLLVTVGVGASYVGASYVPALAEVHVEPHWVPEMRSSPAV